MPEEEHDVQGPSRIDDYDIYEEGEILLQDSILIYAASDLRALARKGNLEGDPALIERALGVGYTAEEAVYGRLFAQNKDNLEKAFGKECFDIYSSALESMKTQTSMSRVEVFDDKCHSSSGCVYGILVDDERKRILVVFRGSANVKDWLEDSRVYLKKIPNPVKEAKHKNLGIHAGFHDYLFSTRGARKTEEDKKCKCDMIMEKVAELSEQNPGYHVCATGHSLGASLSTLFAFKAAASDDPRILKPVMCVNFASPRPGDARLRDAFQVLEQKGQVRCLRFVNKGDVITNMPANQICCCCLISAGVFRHVGMEVELCTERQMNVNFIYAAPGDVIRRLRGDMKKLTEQCVFFVTLPFHCLRGKRYMLRHSCLEYLKQLRRLREDLEKVTLSDLYEDVYEGKGKFDVRPSLCR